MKNIPDKKAFVRGKPASGKRKMSAAGLVGAILLVLYGVARPHINERFGLDLPAFTSADGEHDKNQPPIVKPPVVVASSGDADRGAGGAGATASVGVNGAEKNPSSVDPTQPAASPKIESDTDLKYGLLRDLGKERFLSPAGLLYTPGSQEGHRLKHLERHTADQPSRPGSHGVFDGGMEEALLVLDRAYVKAEKGGAGVTKSEDQDRTVYTVDMGKRIGYVGGRDGNRRRKPMARRVRIVLEGNRVITAYPL